MKIILFRTCPTVMRIDTYNSQELGLAKAFTKMGHQCDIVYYNGSNKSYEQVIEVADKEIIVYWRKGFSVLRNGIFFGINEILRKYDVIQVCEYDQLSSWLTYAFSKKKVFIYHGPYDSELLKKHTLRSKVVDSLLIHDWVTKNKTVFTKSVLAEKTIRKRGFENVITVGVGLDQERLMQYKGNMSENEFVKTAISTKGNCKYLLYVGVLEDRRNIKFLLEVYKRVLDWDENVRLIVVGKGEKTYVDECFDVMEKLGIRKNISYCPSLKQSELAELYTASDLFLLPSKYEIFGMVLLESLYFGLPVVSSYNGGAATLMSDKDVGIVEFDFDAEKWSEDIVGLLNNKKERERMSNNAALLIKTEFMWDSIAKKMLNEYQKYV